MFGSTLALTYLLANVYACVRLRTIFPSAAYRRLVTLVYAFLSLAFPAAEFLSHGQRGVWGRAVQTAGFYALPYLLYFVLSIMAFDLLLGLNHITKILDKRILNSQRFRVIRLSALLLVPLAVVVWGRLNYVHLTVSRYHIALPSKSTPLEHLRIAMAADFHLNRGTNPDFMPRFVDRINSMAPDIVLMPGDILEGDTPDEVTAELESRFREIKAKYGVFACYGNHESYGRRTRPDFFENANIRMLRDAVVQVGDAFYVAGRNYSHSGRRKSLADILAGAPKDLPVLLLDHSPADLSEVSGSRVDIQVSGHTHDGQLFPINWITKIQYPLAWGHKKFGTTHVFVTCGIQGWGPPIRTAGRSEIMLIDVDFVK